MSKINSIGAVGAMLFGIGGSMQAPEGSPIEWLPYVLLFVGLMLIIAWFAVTGGGE